MFVPHRGLLVPAGTPTPISADAAKRRAELAADRDLEAVEREHEITQQIRTAQHRITMAQIADDIEAAERARRERAEDAKSAARIAELYRSAKREGTEARIQSRYEGSGEMRAKRIGLVRKYTLIIGLPILLGFASWSTTGVQAGFVKLFDLREFDPMWFTAWGIEPCLIAIVAAIIIAKSVLHSSGGKTDWRANAAECAALGASVALNMHGGWNAPGWSGLGHALLHSIGTLGAAGTAFLIGLFVSYATSADPWAGAQELAEVGLADDAPARNDPNASVALTHLGNALDSAQPAQRDDQITQSDRVNRPRKQAAQDDRVNGSAQPSISGYAPGEDAATQAAIAFLTRKFDSRRKAADAHGVSDGTVRNRLKTLEVDPTYAPLFAAITHPQINGHPVLAEGANRS